MSFFKTLRNAAIKNLDDVAGTTALTELKSISLPNTALDGLYKSIPFKYDPPTRQIVAGNSNISMDIINKWFRAADLDSIVKNLNLNVKVTGEMQNAMTSLARNVPELKLKELDNIAEVAKRSSPELNIMPGETVDDTIRALGPNGVKKINAIGSKIKKVAAIGGSAVGIYGIWYLTDDLLSSLQDAAKASAGCYLLQTTNGNTKGCKMTDRTCIDTNIEGPKPCDSDTYTRNYMAVISDALTKKINMKDIFGADSDIKTPTEISAALANPTYKQNLIDYYNENSKNTFNVCADEESIFGELTRCRACDSSASYDSINYIDSSTLADNFSFVCKPPSSIMETLIDTATGVGVDILGTIGGLFSGNTFTYIIIAAVVVVLGFILFSFFSKGKKEPTTIIQPQTVGPPIY